MDSKPLRVLSLFDGISCGRLALERAGIPIECYHAAEIDKWAIQVSKKNWPDIVQLGDVSKLNFSKNDYDLIIGGSPCQGFSFAGKQLNFDDPRSKLFFDFDRIIKQVNPTHFLLENVCMKKASELVITEHMGVEPILINSSLVSAQSRKRLYWSNLKITQPEDRHIYLKDIIEQNPEEFELVKLSETTRQRMIRYGIKPCNDFEKARCLSAMEYIKNGKQGNYYAVNYSSSGRGNGVVEDRVCFNPEKSYTITATQMNSRAITMISEDQYWRKLTATECERLQTVPDGYTKFDSDGKRISNSQRYHQLGNGWTVDVIAHILKGIKTNGIS